MMKTLEDMKKITIAVDLDSTLNNLDEVWILQDYNKLYNDNLTAEDMRCWNTHEYVKPECGKKVYDLLLQPGYFRKLGLKDQWTKEVFEWLCDTFDVYVVSSCHPSTVEDKAIWLKEHFPNFDTRKFVACHPKHIISTDFLIDDGPHNIEGFKNKSIMLDAAYNRYLNEAEHNMLRVSNWQTIRTYFETYLLCHVEGHEWGLPAGYGANI